MTTRARREGKGGHPGKCGNHGTNGKGGKGVTMMMKKSLSFTLNPLHFMGSWYCDLERVTMMARKRMALATRVMTMMMADNDDAKGKHDVGTNYDNDGMGREVTVMGQNSNLNEEIVSTRVDNYLARNEI
jgi:hypothetical protein